MSDHVTLRKPSPEPSPAARAGNSGLLQRRCSCPEGGEECEECKSAGPMQRHAAAPVHLSGPAAIPPVVHEALSQGGAPLDSRTRQFMEPRFGHDFSRVRVHTSERASDSAFAVGADAYTFGSDIAFRTGRYAPATNQGRGLLAHELAHVVQQSSAGPLPRGVDSGPTDPLEIAAEEMAHDALDDRGDHVRPRD